MDQPHTPQSQSDDEKLSVGDVPGSPLADKKHANDVEEFEARLARDDASKEEYLVANAHDVAIKVSLHRFDGLAALQLMHT